MSRKLFLKGGITVQKVLVFKSQESASEYLAITFAAKIAKNNSLNARL